MKDDTKAIIAFILTVILIFIGIVCLIKYGNKLAKQNLQKEQQDIQECYNKTNDLNYCLEIFNK